MTKTAYIGIFALLLLMFLVNVLLDTFGDTNTATPPTAHAGDATDTITIRTGNGPQQPNNPTNAPNPAEEPTAPLIRNDVVVLPPDTSEPVGAETFVAYTVKDGDKCWNIARDHLGSGAKWTLIQKANPTLVGAKGELQKGVTLRIPVEPPRAAAEPAQPAPQVTSSRSAAAAAPPRTAGKPYTVQSGDTCWELAEAFYGNPSQWTRIRDANPDKVGRNGALSKGQIIVIPGVQ